MLTEECSEKYLKKLIGRTDIEDALKRLDKLTQEESRMAAAEILKVAHAVDERVKGVADTVAGIDNRVADVDDRVAGVDDRVAGVDERVTGVGDQVARVDERVLAVDERVLAVDERVLVVDERVLVVDERVLAVDERVAGVVDQVAGVNDRVADIDEQVAGVVHRVTGVDDRLQRAANNVDEIKRWSSLDLSSADHATLPILSGNQLRENIYKWLSPPDPSTNHNIACGTHHKKSATWFFQGSIFKDWKSTGSLLWIHGKRLSHPLSNSTRSDNILHL